MSAIRSKLGKGLGSIEDVGNHYAEMLAAEPIKSAAIRNLSHELANMLSEHNEAGVAIALIASFMNTQTVTTGYVWFMDDRGRLSWEHVDSKELREILSLSLSS